MGFSGKLWSILVIVTIIVLLIVGIYYLLSDEPMDQNSYSGIKPEDVVINYEEYIGENITVEGYIYDPDPADNFAYVSSQLIEEPLEQGEFVDEELLLINYSNLENISGSTNKYYFQGPINEIQNERYPVDLIYLNVKNLEMV
ncbi:MAG: hypothetical protein ACOCUT_01935 [bacterium]